MYSDVGLNRTAVETRCESRCYLLTDRHSCRLHVRTVCERVRRLIGISQAECFVNVSAWFRGPGFPRILESTGKVLEGVVSKALERCTKCKCKSIIEEFPAYFCPWWTFCNWLHQRWMWVGRMDWIQKAKIDPCYCPTPCIFNKYCYCLSSYINAGWFREGCGKNVLAVVETGKSWKWKKTRDKHSVVLSKLDNQATRPHLAICPRVQRACTGNCS